MGADVSDQPQSPDEDPLSKLPPNQIPWSEYERRRHCPILTSSEVVREIAERAAQLAADRAISEFTKNSTPVDKAVISKILWAVGALGAGVAAYFLQMVDKQP